MNCLTVDGLKMDGLKLNGLKVERPEVVRLLRVDNLSKDQSRRSADKPMGKPLTFIILNHLLKTVQFDFWW